MVCYQVLIFNPFKGIPNYLFHFLFVTVNLCVRYCIRLWYLCDKIYCRFNWQLRSHSSPGAESQYYYHNHLISFQICLSSLIYIKQKLTIFKKLKCYFSTYIERRNTQQFFTLKIFNFNLTSFFFIQQLLLNSNFFHIQFSIKFEQAKMNSMNKKHKISFKKYTQKNREILQISDAEDVKQKGKYFVNKILFSSLQQSLQSLMACLMSNNLPSSLLSEIEKKRQAAKTIDLSEINIQKDKQEYCSLIYFKMKMQLVKFPEDVSKKLSEFLNSFYFRMAKEQKMNVLRFYQQIKNIIDDQINKHIITNQSNKKGPYDNQSQKKLEGINKIMNNLYGITEASQFFLSSSIEQINQQNYFSLLEHQYTRNEGILRKIIQFSTKMKKCLVSKRIRIFSQDEILKSRTLGSFKIKKSISVHKNKQNLVKPPDITRQQKQNNFNRIYLKPIIKTRVRLIL